MLNQRYPEISSVRYTSGMTSYPPVFKQNWTSTVLFSIQKPLQDNFCVNKMDMFHEELELPVQQKVGTLVTSGNHQLVLRKKSTEIQESMRILWLKRGPSIFLQAMRATENT